MLTPDDKLRYDRQIMIPGFGEEGQEKLKKARVVIAGVGGLGSPIAIYLAAAGVGTIRIIDRDTVDLSNLNRQVLHWQKDVGRKKVESAVEKLRAINPGISVEAIADTIDENNVRSLLKGYDVVVDAMDNSTIRFLLNKTALEFKMPFVHGAVYGLEGRAMTVVPGSSACLRCLYKGNPPQEKFPVLGTTPAIIACIQVTEIIKIITGIGTLLTDRLLIYDGRSMKFTELILHRDETCEHCGNV
jgi:molybdopterin-synthase adenylyltransferase